MKTVFIYSLNCPITGSPRYVGKSASPKKRFSKHLLRSKKETHHRANWIRFLAAQNLKPRLEILDEVLESEWQQWEVAYIEFFREQGCDLVNGTVGGDGTGAGEKHPCYGRKLTSEHRAAISLANLGKVVSAETRIKQSVLRKGILTGENHPMFGKCHSSETRKRISASLRGRIPSPESNAKRVATLANKKGRGNKSGFVGISWHSKSGKWRAVLPRNSCKGYDSLFVRLEDAVFARNLALDKYNYGGNNTSPKPK